MMIIINCFNKILSIIKTIKTIRKFFIDNNDKVYQYL